MFLKSRCFVIFSVLGWLSAVLCCPVFGADWKVLPGHVPRETSTLTASGRVAATNQLRLAIGVPLRDPAGLDEFLAQLYDPASTNYHRFLTPEQFADRFGPTAADYESVQVFARSNGLTVTGTHGNRLVLDVVGSAAAVEKTLRISLLTFQHPTEGRQCFAPDTEPTVPAGIPVADVQGLSDFHRPHPKVKRMDAASLAPRSGTAPDSSGSYFGDDFRNAYLPGTPLTGAGQMVGLLQFDGFYANDIAAYARAAGGGRTNIVIQTVLTDSYNGTPTSSGNIEVSLDIEMAMAMAPGLSKIVVFEADPNTGNPNTILSAMLTNTAIKQFSCSWGWGGGPSTTTDNLFKNMATAGQSFFNASGDSDAFTAGATSVNGVDNTSIANAPSSSPYIMQVGGTTLVTTNGGAYQSESVWNRGGGTGSSGGISSYYSLPGWQTNISSLAARGGSTSFRNIPDVALTAENIYVVYGGSAGGTDGVGGTSCAAPLWAGYMALLNQQAAANGVPSAGFINPAIYRIAATADYTNCFYDTTVGNNTWSSSPSLFYATNGYDLCTGLGAPGPGLIAALASPNDTLAILPAEGFAFGGPFGGPFVPSAGSFVLTNNSGSAVTWSLASTSLWLAVEFTNGVLAAHTSTNLNVGVAANTLPLGNYSATLSFTNSTSHVAQGLFASLQIYQPLSVTPIKGFAAVGPVGGPFTSASEDFTLTNLSGGAVSWSIINTSAWLTVSSSSGTLAGGGQATVTVALAAAANALPAAVYTANVMFTNQNGAVALVPFTVAIGQPVLVNGGFETGDFSGWTQSGNTSYAFVTNASTYVHSGARGAKLGPYGSLGYLSQDLTTSAGQRYLLSVWLRNPSGGSPTLFQVQWNGTTIFNQTNLTSTGWTNLLFFVTAASSNTPLQLGFQNDPSYFGLDDVSVTPLAVPAFKSAARSVGNFQLSWSTTTGLVYQVQYKTNILQGNWVNLGSAVTATTGTLTLVDTNALKFPQRFYRLQMSP